MFAWAFVLCVSLFATFVRLLIPKRRRRAGWGEMPAPEEQDGRGSCVVSHASDTEEPKETGDWWRVYCIHWQDAEARRFECAIFAEGFPDRRSAVRFAYRESRRAHFAGEPHLYFARREQALSEEVPVVLRGAG